MKKIIISSYYEEDEELQVNFSSYVDDREEYWISRYSEDGYCGRLTDQVYLDGEDYTDWCIFHGTKDEIKYFLTEKGYEVV